MRFIAVNLRAKTRNASAQRDATATLAEVKRCSNQYRGMVNEYRTEWYYQTDGVIKELAWVESKQHFSYRIQYYSARLGKMQTFCDKLQEDWVAKYYDAVIVQHIKDSAQGQGFVDVLPANSGKLMTNMVGIKKESTTGKSTGWKGLLDTGEIINIPADKMTVELSAFYTAKRRVATDKDAFVLLTTEVQAVRVPVNDAPPIVAVKYTRRQKRVLVSAGNKAQYVSDDCWVGKDAEGHFRDMDETAVLDMFGSAFVGELRRRCNRKYVEIPIGSYRESRLSLFPSLQRVDAPCVWYQQGEHDTCIYSSMASCLRHLGMLDAALHISQTAVADVGFGGPRLFNELARRLESTEAKFLQQRALPELFDWGNMEKNTILCASLKSEDGSVVHAVTIWGGWIFDSNEKKAIPLSKFGLDVCTQSDEEAVANVQSPFVSFAHGKLFVDGTKNQRMLKRYAQVKP